MEGGKMSDWLEVVQIVNVNDFESFIVRIPVTILIGDLALHLAV